MGFSFSFLKGFVPTFHEFPQDPQRYLTRYRRGDHVLFEPTLEREQMRRNLEWFQKWIPAK